jgi:hypothetical protein
MSKLDKAQTLWLSTNKATYERVLLHAALHDKSRRVAVMGVPLTSRDFSDNKLSAIWQGLVLAETIMQKMGTSMPTPPTVEQLRSYMLAAVKEQDSVIAEDDVEPACEVLSQLQSDSLKDQWYFLDFYFTAWMTSSRTKSYARKAQMYPVIDSDEIVNLITRDIQKANAAVYSPESDDMYQALYGTSELGRVRRPTGFAALDQATGGGLGDSECFGLFSGTKGGKSVCACQVGYYNASVGGDTLIISTEMRSMDYISRMISNACNIKISLIKDCMNVGQLRQVVAMDNPPALQKLESVIATIADRVRIVKIHPDQGLGARAIMEQQTRQYTDQKGRAPTLVIFDWLGRIADSGGSTNSSDRILAWERAADSCVQFCEIHGIPALILLQAVNNAQTKSVLTLEDVGISKGVFKQFTMAFGITNTIDKAAIKQAMMSGAIQDTMRTTLEDQLFCVVASRKGEATYIPVRRQFLYQRFAIGRSNR